MAEESKGDIVTPFNVAAGETGVDYERLLEQFGCQRVTPDMVERIGALTGQRPHRFLRRQMYFAHRDLDTVLTHHEQGKQFYLYTGRGPSSEAMHLGHLVPFMFTKWLSDAFNVPVVIMITDDEKYLYRPELTLEEVQKYARENIRDIIACGFDINKTFIFLDTQYIQYMYPNHIKMQKHITVNQIYGCFGFNNSDNVGKIAYPPLQAVPAFANTFPHLFGEGKDVRCLIPDAIDQDPYFRMTRDVCPRINYLKPACLHSKFFPALQGLTSKMSASLQHTAIFVTDSPQQIKKKINRHAFSGGGRTLEEQRQFGANLAVDVPYQWLTFFMEDDEQLADIADKYSKGQMLTGEVKKILIELVQEFLAEHQRRRAEVTEELIDEYMRIRPLSVLS